MRVVTLNVNGIRSAVDKGILRWLRAQRADVICLQEIRARLEQHPPSLRQLSSGHQLRYSQHYVDASKKGYSGVGILSRREPDRVVTRLGYRPFDVEGRYLRADFGKLSVLSVYMPSGSSSPARQAFKLRALKRLRAHLDALRGAGRECIVCGDLNVAHKRIDVKNWRANQTHPGFLPEERAFMDRLTTAGYVDAFRVAEPRGEQYTWWSNRGRAWAKNVGWRLDYQLVTPRLGTRVDATEVYKRKRFSDHAPVTVDYAWKLTS